MTKKVEFLKVPGETYTGGGDLYIRCADVDAVREVNCNSFLSVDIIWKSGKISPLTLVLETEDHMTDYDAFMGRLTLHDVTVYPAQ